MLESWVTAKRISNIVPASSVHPFEMKALQVLTPASLALRKNQLRLQKSFWPIVIELLTRQQVAPEDSKRFHSSQEFLLNDDIVALSRCRLAGIVFNF